MTLIQATATHAANEHINYHCRELEHEAKLRRWKEVYDTTLAALAFFERSLQDQHRETLLHVSVN